MEREHRVLVLDIETTGLPDWRPDALIQGAMHYYAPGVLEIAAQLWNHDFSEKIDTFHAVINAGPNCSDYKMDDFVRKMHTENGLLAACEASVLRPEIARLNWRAFIEKHYGMTKRDVVACGKNAAGFDIPILQANSFATPFKHRVLDVGSLCWQNGCPPDLAACKAGLGIGEPVAHRAMGDVEDCVNVIRAVMACRSYANTLMSAHGGWTIKEPN